MASEPVVVRKKWNIDLLVGSGFTPLTGIQTSHFSFEANEGDNLVRLLLDLSANDSDEYFEFVEHSDGFKYISIFDMDGMITKDLLTFVKTITGKELKDIEYELHIQLNSEKQVQTPASLIYQNELFLCKKGVIPSVLK